MPAKKRGSRSTSLVPVERVQRSILVVRGYKVLLDRDLSEIYAVPVKQLNQAVRRNIDRFPPDFMFQLTWEESRGLRSQIVTLEPGKHLRYRPFAFTEHGAVMLASVLNSPVAVQASIAVVRAFVRLRELLSSNEQFRRKLDDIEQRLSDHDEKLGVAFDAIRQLMDESEEAEAGKGKPRIGYQTEAERQARSGGASGSQRRRS
jgi:hypothetical protein